jgi:hypothetical protein
LPVTTTFWSYLHISNFVQTEERLSDLEVIDSVLFGNKSLLQNLVSDTTYIDPAAIFGR